MRDALVPPIRADGAGWFVVGAVVGGGASMARTSTVGWGQHEQDTLVCNHCPQVLSPPSCHDYKVRTSPLLLPMASNLSFQSWAVRLIKIFSSLPIGLSSASPWNFPNLVSNNSIRGRQGCQLNYVPIHLNSFRPGLTAHVIRFLKLCYRRSFVPQAYVDHLQACLCGPYALHVVACCWSHKASFNGY